MDYSIAYEDHAIQLQCYRPAVTGKLTTLTLPPQAGHSEVIANWPAPGQNLMETICANTDGGVYMVAWKSCTHERRNESYVDLVEQVSTAIMATGDFPVRLVGLCQGGTLATIYAALYPSDVAHLVVAGAPIDVSLGDSVLKQAQETPLWMYKMIVAMNGGIVSGHWLGSMWKSGNWRTHYVDRFTCPDDRTEAFYAWYDDTRCLAGGWYLELIEQLFLNNLLIQNKFMVGDKVVDLRNIACHVDLIAGDRDDITPHEQLFALCQHVPQAKCHIVPGGHIGLFMGAESQPTWGKVCQLPKRC